MWRVACVTRPVEYQMYKQKATIGYFILHSQVLSAALHCTVHARLEVTSLVWRSTDCGEQRRGARWPTFSGIIPTR